ncbi:hypothetical protein LCGC14_0143220 [marine sediment metagenome]|uniref:Uncharacterized protein n=1 Tax=marine sediment metagenome TaxID=412755 RepID=A0A0F9V4Z5_9ZZZZ
MDVNDVSVIVDSLADKVGMAAERILPVAETMIEEVVRSNTFAAWTCLAVWPLFVALGVALFWGCFNLAKRCRQKEDGSIIRIVGGIFGTLIVVGSTIVCLVNSIAYYMDALQPTTIVVQRILG